MKNLKLKAKRVECGISQQDMANKLGMTITSYNFKENGKREFTIKECIKLVQILECKFEDIFIS